MLASRFFYKLFTLLFIVPAFVIVMVACNDAGNTDAETNEEADINENTNEGNETAEEQEESETAAGSDASGDDKIVHGIEYQLVGQDIPAGEYAVIKISNEGDMFDHGSIRTLADLNDPDNEFLNVLMNSLEYAYITVEEGEYFGLESAEATPIEDAEPFIPDDGKYKSGIYKVGRDLPAGVYDIFEDDDPDVMTGMQILEDSIYDDEVLKGHAGDNNWTGKLEDIDPETYEDYKNGIVRLEDGQYLWIQGNYYIEVE